MVTELRLQFGPAEPEAGLELGNEDAGPEAQPIICPHVKWVKLN